MKHQWHAEVKITEELVKALIEKQFQSLSPAVISPIGDGWDNSAFLVNKKYVFRFPRRQISLECLKNETKILPKIAPLLPLPVPVPIFKGRPSKHFPWPFSGYPLLPGTTACRKNLTEEERIKMAPVIADFLKKLHSIPLEDAYSYGAEPDKIGRLNFKKRIPGMYRYLDGLVEKGVIKRPEPVIEFIKSISVKPDAPKTALVHGDFYVRHILVDKNNNISGIIDWGDMHTGNPAIDISIARGFLPAEGQRIFREIYGEIGEITWKLAEVKAFYMALILLSYGHDIGDSSLVEEAEISFKRILP